MKHHPADEGERNHLKSESVGLASSCCVLQKCLHSFWKVSFLFLFCFVGVLLAVFSLCFFFEGGEDSHFNKFSEFKNMYDCKLKIASPLNGENRMRY